MCHTKVVAVVATDTKAAAAEGWGVGLTVRCAVALSYALHILHLTENKRHMQLGRPA